MPYQCPTCVGTGCNKTLPKITKGMWRACSVCDGAGFLPLVSIWKPGETEAIYNRMKDGSLVWSGKVKYKELK